MATREIEVAIDNSARSFPLSKMLAPNIHIQWRDNKSFRERSRIAFAYDSAVYSWKQKTVKTVKPFQSRPWNFPYRPHVLVQTNSMAFLCVSSEVYLYIM